MKALVTGGAGFIGSTIVARLLARGDTVVVFDDLSSGYRANLDGRAEFVNGDVRDPHAVIRAARGADLIFHLAASVGNKRGIDNPSADASINAIGTINVLEAARLAGCERVVYSSSAAIFGEPDTIPVGDGHATRPTTPYGVSKLAGELYVRSYAQLHGINGVCLRYFNVYGERQRFDAYGNVIPIFATRALSGEPLLVFGDGEQTRDFVNVDDVASANLLAADPGAPSGSFNVGSGTAVTVNALVAILATLCGGDLKVEHRPERPGDVRHSRADISNTSALLGYAPKHALEDGLRRYLGWLERDMAGATR